MFPSFVTSFQDQLTAVFINLIGTVTASVINLLVTTFVNSVVSPLLNELAANAGLGA